MTTMLRWLVVTVLAVHGLIHLLGAASGFGLADVSQLTQPIGVPRGVLWLVAALVVLAAAASLAVGAPTWWWATAVVAAALSQSAITTSWDDARVGTVVNVVLILAAAYGFAAEGPTSFHAQYRERARQSLSDANRSPAVLQESELDDLPTPLAAYIRRSGAVGHATVVSFRADFHGRIRSAPDAAWMPFAGQQVNTFGSRPRRTFLMDATRSGIPVTVLHVFADSTATMRVKLLSLIPVVDAAGAEMNRGETVTVFNDLVVMAPGAIAGAPVSWTAIDSLHVRGDFTDGDQTVSAVLTFNAEHDLVDFVSDDRSRASGNGRSFTPQRWSTPLTGHHDVDGHRVPAVGQGVWHAPQPEGSFTYLEFALDAIEYNAGHPGTSTPESAPVMHSR